jgi:hypothetical protein
MSLYFTMGPICQQPTLYPTAPPARSPPFLSVLHFPPMETQCHWPAAGSPPRPTTGRPRSPPARALLVVPSRFPPLLASPRLPCLPRCARPCSGAGGGEGAWAQRAASRDDEYDEDGGLQRGASQRCRYSFELPPGSSESAGCHAPPRPRHPAPRRPARGPR